VDSKEEAQENCCCFWLLQALRKNEKQLIGGFKMKKLTLKWKVSKKPEKVIRKAASHFTFKSCTVKCGE